jgi:hydrogenase maturation protease
LSKPSGERIALMCIGNLLMADEGVGCHIAERLPRTFDFPSNVEVLDSGTMGMSLLNDVMHFDYIVVIDAVDGTGTEPGTVLTFTPEQVAPHTVQHSLHDVRFINVLDAARLLGCEPVGIYVGVQTLDMEPVDFCMELTRPVEAAVPLAMETAISLLVAHGVTGITRVNGDPLVPEGHGAGSETLG